MRQKRRETEAVQVIVRTYLNWKVRFLILDIPNVSSWLREWIAQLFLFSIGNSGGGI
jgi:hypothetical protein